MSKRPTVKHDKLNTLLREENIEMVNKYLEKGAKPDFSSTDFRALHLAGLVVQNIDFSNSYFRLADIRGIDFTTCNLEGASLHGANVSGCLFPKELSASEIRMSIELGTRLRYR